jgi:hypothetical protein
VHVHKGMRRVRHERGRWRWSSWEAKERQQGVVLDQILEQSCSQTIVRFPHSHALGTSEVMTQGEALTSVMARL